MKLVVVAQTDCTNTFGEALSLPSDCSSLKAVGAFSFRNGVVEPPSCSVQVCSSGLESPRVSGVANQFLRLRGGRFNLLWLGAGGSNLATWQDIPALGEVAIPENVARRMKLAIASLNPCEVGANESAWFNPFVATFQLWDSYAPMDLSVVRHCTTLPTDHVTIDFISVPADRLKDALFELLACKLAKLEAMNLKRRRSLVERLIFGRETGTYLHRAFMGLDVIGGTFWCANFGTPTTESGCVQFHWASRTALPPMVEEIAKFWCKCLGVIYTETQVPDWDIVKEDAYVGHRNLCSDWHPANRWSFLGSGLASLIEIMTSHTDQSRAGNRLRRCLKEHVERTREELPLPIRAWNTFSVSKSNQNGITQRRLSYADFVNAAWRSLLFESRILVAFPAHRTRLDQMEKYRDRRDHQAEQFKDRFENRAFDLTYTRQYGVSAFVEKLFRGLTCRGRTDLAVRLEYKSEWWKRWENAMYLGSAESVVYFKAPGEGPYYIGVSKFGDKLGLPADKVDEVFDEYHWVGEVF